MRYLKCSGDFASVDAIEASILMQDTFVRYYGWSALSVETPGGALFFDPFYRPYCGAKWFELHDFRHAKYIAVTHGHEEHFLDVPVIAKTTGAIVIGQPSVTRFLRRRCEIPAAQLLSIQAGGTIVLPSFEVSAFHWKHRDINLIKTLSKAVFHGNTTQLSWAWSSATKAPFYSPYTGYLVRLPGGYSIMNYNEGFNTNMTDQEIHALAAKARPNVLLAGMQLDFVADLARGVRALRPDITVLFPPHDKLHAMMGIGSRPWDDFGEAARAAHPDGKVIVAEPGTSISLPEGLVALKRPPQAAA